MSAPNTNLAKERRRHRGPLIGMGLGVIFVLGILLFWLGSEFSLGTAPGTVSDPSHAAPSAQDADDGSVPTDADPLSSGESPAVVTPATPSEE